MKLKKVLLSDYFSIVGAKQTDKINVTVTTKDNNNSCPFIGRSNSNNGVVDYVIRKEELVNAGNVITVALDGSTGATFYQYHDFMSGQNIWKLIPKNEKIDRFNHYIALYILPSIRKAVEGYSYNLGLTKTRLLNIRILLPVKSGKVDINYIEKYMLDLRNIKILNCVPNRRL